MSGNGVNTLEYAHKLEKAGVPREQAEAHAMVFYELMHSELATKRDIADVKKEIKEIDLKIENVRSELKRDIEIVKKDLKIWMGGFAMTGLGVLVVLAKLGLLTPM